MKPQFNRIGVLSVCGLDISPQQLFLPVIARLLRLIYFESRPETEALAHDSDKFGRQVLSAKIKINRQYHQVRPEGVPS
jgi:hypothetical protein